MTRIVRIFTGAVMAALLLALGVAYGAGASSRSAGSVSPATNTVGDLTSVKLLTTAQLANGNAGSSAHKTYTDLKAFNKFCSESDFPKQRAVGWKQGVYQVYFSKDQKSYLALVCLNRYTSSAAAHTFFTAAKVVKVKPGEKFTAKPFKLGDEAVQGTGSSKNTGPVSAIFWRHANVVLTASVAGPKSTLAEAQTMARAVEQNLTKS